MKLLFVAYCFGSADGQALIGVYKRGLRLAMRLVERGHEIVFFCTGREAYQDELTRAAEARMQFIDIPFVVGAHDAARRTSDIFRRTLRDLAPDVIVVGEAPLSGAMLEATLVGAELEIPVTLLDNAYNALFVELFLRHVGPITDGIVLMGPSSHHLTEPPAFLCQVPPMIDSDPTAATALLETTFGSLDDSPLVTVLAYDAKVERLATSMLPDLVGAGATVVFCSRDPEACRRRWPALPPTARVAALAQPSEATLIGLLDIASLAIVKYGFMQVAECLTLGTPAIVVYHEGPTWVDYLPPSSRACVWVTASPARDRRTVEAALSFLDQPSNALDEIHDGRLDALERAAAFFDAIPRTPRDTTSECAALGFDRPAVIAALDHALPGRGDDLVTTRAIRVRTASEADIYILVCRLRDGSTIRLWGRCYADPDAAAADQEHARHDPHRRIFHFDATTSIAIEADLGEALLPPLNP
ncbi:MAG: hypothetical protein AAGD38_05700 [Acidobacteriota bacterium]